MRLLQEAAVSVRIRSTDFKRQPIRLGEEIERHSIYLNTEVDAKRVMQRTAERIDFLLRLDDYKVSQKILERILLDQ